MKCYKLFFLFWATLILVGCNKDTEKIHLEPGYLGILSFEYTRSFPPIDLVINIDLELKKNGQVLFSDPKVHAYDASDEVNHTLKIREEGHITVNSLTGEANVYGSEKYILINNSILIKGITKIWGWDDQIGWVNTQSEPLEIIDPLKNLLKFNFTESTLKGDEISTTISGINGDMNFKWTLLLFPKLEN